KLSAVDEKRFGRPLLAGVRCRLALRHGRLLRLAQAKRKPGRRSRRKYRARARFARGLLASCLTWLQAGRPNHHDLFGLIRLVRTIVKAEQPGNHPPAVRENERTFRRGLARG